MPGSVIGTPAYMSPEQAEGRLGDIEPASDVHILGATLFSLLTGKPPVADREVVDIIRKLQRGEVTPAWRVNPRVSKALEAGVRKAMAVRSAARYASARSLAADIDHSLAGEPVSAWHQPRLVRARSWIRCHQTAATGIAAAVAEAGLMAVSVVQAELERSDGPAARSELAAAYMQVGWITAQVGQRGETLEDYERARTIPRRCPGRPVR